MSFIFEHDDEVIWSPALRIGAAYLAVAQGFASFMAIPTGLIPMANDYFIIDESDFKTFVESVHERFGRAIRWRQVFCSASWPCHTCSFVE